MPIFLLFLHKYENDQTELRSYSTKPHQIFTQYSQIQRHTPFSTAHRRSDILMRFGTTVRQMKVCRPKTPILPIKFVAIATFYERWLYGFSRPFHSYTNPTLKIW